MTKQKEKEIDKALQNINTRLCDLNHAYTELGVEWKLYEAAYKRYISKKYRIRDWLFGIYCKIRTGKYPDIRRKTRRRMARIFSD